MSLVFCIDIHVCTIPKGIGINKGKEICLANKEFLSDHRCEITNTVAKCEISMNCSKNFIGIFRKQILKRS